MLRLMIWLTLMILSTTPSFNRLRLANAVRCRSSKEDVVIKRGSYSQFTWEVLLSVFCQSSGVIVVSIED